MELTDTYIGASRGISSTEQILIFLSKPGKPVLDDLPPRQLTEEQRRLWPYALV